MRLILICESLGSAQEVLDKREIGGLWVLGNVTDQEIQTWVDKRKEPLYVKYTHLHVESVLRYGFVVENSLGYASVSTSPVSYQIPEHNPDVLIIRDSVNLLKAWAFGAREVFLSTNSRKMERTAEMLQIIAAQQIHMGFTLEVCNEDEVMSALANGVTSLAVTPELALKLF
jgi:hypothetical protein